MAWLSFMRNQNFIWVAGKLCNFDPNANSLFCLINIATKFLIKMMYTYVVMEKYL